MIDCILYFYRNWFDIRICSDEISYLNFYQNKCNCNVKVNDTRYVKLVSLCGGSIGFEMVFIILAVLLNKILYFEVKYL